MQPKFIAKTRITKQGQLTLPFEARNDLSIELNSDVYWYELGNCLVVVKDLVSEQELLKKVLRNK